MTVPAIKLPTELRLDLAELNAAYAACLDGGSLMEWPRFFTEDCLYRIISRENYDAGLPLATLSLQGQGMLLDRIYGIESTIFHAPYHQRHIIGPSGVMEHDGNEIRTQTNYLVVRTKRDHMADLLNAGVYLDRIAITAIGLRLAERICVFDNDLIPNSLIYPI